jgi:hypothetical protein
MVKITKLTKENCINNVVWRNSRFRVAVLLDDNTFSWVGFASTVNNNDIEEGINIDLEMYMLATKEGSEGYTLIVPNPKGMEMKMDRDAIAYFNNVLSVKADKENRIKQELESLKEKYKSDKEIQEKKVRISQLEDLRIDDRIHINSRNGMYRVAKLGTDTFTITWSKEGKEVFLEVYNEDFKCMAGGRNNLVRQAREIVQVKELILEKEDDLPF